MQKSKLITVLDSLSNKEVKAFKQFVASPFFNSQKILVPFLAILLEYRRELQLMPQKEKVFGKLFPQQDYEDTKMRLLMSNLYKLLEHFLAYQGFFDDSIQERLVLAQAYRKRNLSTQFQRLLKATKARQEQLPYRNAEYFNERYQIQMEEYQFLSDSKRTEQLNLQEISTNLDTFFLLLKLRQTCLALAHQRVYNTEYDFGMLPQVLNYIEDQHLLDEPALATYYYCYYSLTHAGEEHYFKQFKTLLLQHTEKFSTSELRDLFILALNYCIKQLNAGHHNYAKEGLELYKTGLAQEFLLDNGVISRFTYNNIVAMGLREQAYDWVDQFLNQYRTALPKKYREGTYSFNLARLSYRQKKYDHAMILLQKMDYKDLLNNLIAKTLLSKIYYELDEYDLLESHLDTMKTFIRRKKIIGYHRENYLNVIHYTKKLLSANLYDSKVRMELQQMIRAEEVLTEKDWLLEQLNK